MQAILARNCIPPHAMSDPLCLVEATSLYAALEDMAASINDPYFCGSVARDQALVGAPTLNAAAARADTLGAFLLHVIDEIGRQFDNVIYALQVTKNAAVFSIRRTRVLSQPTTQVDAVGISFYVSVLRHGLGPVFDPLRILVSAPSIEGVPPGLLPGQVLARSPSVALSITFPLDWLFAPFHLPWANANNRIHSPESAPDAPETIEYFRELIRRNLSDHDFNLGSLAKVCGTNRRRLQRILAANATSFRAIQDQLRRSACVDLVIRSNLPLKEIGWKTGFRSEAAFARSYRRWTGQSASEHRRRLRSG